MEKVLNFFLFILFHHNPICLNIDDNLLQIIIVDFGKKLVFN